MKNRRRPGLPARLERARERFERWRRTRRVRRIPERLWSSAVQLAGEFGINPTARALRLDYYSLKKRVDSTGGPESSVDLVPSFCELVPAERLGSAEWVVQLEDREGTRMRIEHKGGGLSELALLARSLWSGRG